MVPTKKETKKTKKTAKVESVVQPVVEEPTKPEVTTPLAVATPSYEACYVGSCSEGQVRMKHYPRGVWKKVSAQEAEMLKGVFGFRVREVKA